MPSGCGLPASAAGGAACALQAGDAARRPARCRRRAAEGGASPSASARGGGPLKLPCISAGVAALRGAGGVLRCCGSCMPTASGGGCYAVAAGGCYGIETTPGTTDRSKALKLLPPPSFRLGPDEDCCITSKRSCSPPHGLARPHTVSPAPTRSRL